MVKTNAEKQKEYNERVKAKNSDLPKKKAGKEKEQIESFWRNYLHSINEKTVRERLLRKQHNNLSIHRPIPLLRNLVSKHLERQNIELANA